MPDELKAWVKGFLERATEPFLFALTVSWAWLNWRFLLVVFHAPAPSSLSAMLDIATRQLGPHWFDDRWIDLAVGDFAAFAFALGYSFGYPLLAFVIRDYRGQLAIQQEEKLALKKAISDRTIQKADHDERLFSRKDWLNAPETSELRTAILTMLGDYAPEKGPRVVSFAEAAEGDIPVGFAVLDEKNRVVRCRGSLKKTDQLVYVVSSFPATGLVLVGTAGCVVPLPTRIGPKFHYVGHDGKSSASDEPPRNCAAHVERSGEISHWGKIVAGPVLN